tara:strand:- start:726 stop:878 length:153 start_codon:yes stop_codon:yes gene_type:complete
LIILIRSNEKDKTKIDNNKSIKLLNLRLKNTKVKNNTNISDIFLILFFKL